jgi:hypothetical protein
MIQGLKKSTNLDWFYKGSKLGSTLGLTLGSKISLIIGIKIGIKNKGKNKSIVYNINIDWLMES